MKKKVTNEEVGETLGKIADKVRSDMDFNFRVSRSRMWIAETELIESLNEKQRALYDEYRKERDAFYDIAKELYQRKF